MSKPIWKRFFASFSLLGLALGLLFLCASLTPSLLPRLPAVQGALSGIAFASGYGIGVGLVWVWRGLDLALLPKNMRRWIAGLGGILLVALTAFTFHRNSVWQNSIRERMELADVEATYPWLIAGTAALAALALILLGRAIIGLGKFAARRLEMVLPRRTAIVLAALAVGLLTLELANGFLFQGGLRAMDEMSAVSDRIIDDGVIAPTHAFASGGPNSEIAWEDIGKRGKEFLTLGPSRTELEAFSGEPALEPVRVYAGYASADTLEERAAIALRDLIQLGGFERSVLVIATPTGTGWLDPSAVQPLPYFFNGDIAIVSAQYSYVPSWVSLLSEPDRSRRAAQALFDAVYDHWRQMPDDERPKLYLFGLSLGALGSEASADLISVFSDPIDGALWSGPPFASTSWAQLTAARNEGSPFRLPEFRNGSLVRFMNQDEIATPPDAVWGSMRLLYLQYGSDPMPFFSPNLLLRRPDWLTGGNERARDVSPFFNWYPVVTMLQVAFDIPMAAFTEQGYGHTYSAEHYINGWVEVLQPDGWSDDDTERLKGLFNDFDPSPV